MNNILRFESREWYNSRNKDNKGVICEIYDTMAAIISYLNRKADPEKLYASSDSAVEKNEVKLKELYSNKDRLDGINSRRLFEENKSDFVFLTVLLQFLDEKGYLLRKREWQTDVFSFEDMRCIDGLNSAENQRETHILLIPRYYCIWDGHSKEKNHILDMNIYMEYSYFVEIDEGKVQHQYTIKNYILDTGVYGVCPDDQRELFVTPGLSPVSKNILLDVRKYEEQAGGYNSNYFVVEPLSSKYEGDIRQRIRKVLRDADRDGVDLLVFPEMLGSENLIRYLSDTLEDEPLRNIKFFVAPSVWKKQGKHNNTNISYVINFEGNLWFGQDKLKPFPMRQQEGTYIEDIRDCDTIHIIHCYGYGSIAVPICRSQLDEKIKDILIRKLNVKLLLCPSWSTGNYEFETSIMSGAERCCNTVWCNTCSALADKTAEDKVIGIITGYGKNRIYSDNSFSKRKFPDQDNEEDEPGRGCTNCREKGCYYVKRIYGTDYTEDDLEEGVED